MILAGLGVSMLTVVVLASSEGQLSATGVIQADEVRIASEFSGSVVAVAVDLGETVVPGQVLVTLANVELQAQVGQAKAALATARADLALSQAEPRDVAVAAQQANLAMAQAERNLASAAADTASKALREPYGLQRRALEAEAQVALARAGLELAKAQAAEAEYLAQQSEWNSPDRQILELHHEALQAEAAAAEADLSAAEMSLRGLQDMVRNPLTLQVAARAAQGVARIAEAQVEVAGAALRDLLAGPAEAETEIARALVALAEAELSLAQAQLGRLTLLAPTGGTVAARMANPGETVMPGAALLTLADLGELRLTVYLPQTDLDRVFVGQEVAVTVDSLPGHNFLGRVVHIADQAEYTPRNIATREERVNTVFAVKVGLESPEGLLRPGMTAEAVFRP
jgi:HlyD family secretion protein